MLIYLYIITIKKSFLFQNRKENYNKMSYWQLNQFDWNWKLMTLSKERTKPGLLNILNITKKNENIVAPFSDRMKRNLARFTFGWQFSEISSLTVLWLCVTIIFPAYHCYCKTNGEAGRTLFTSRCI